MTIADLRAHDQEIWTKAYRGQCPGYTVGNFESGDRESYVFNLFRRKGKRFFEVLLVISPDEQGIQFYVLSKAQEIAYVTVVSKQPPGVYVSADRTAKIKSKLSVIAATAFEVGEIVYYWSGGRYRSIQTSE